MQPQDEKLDGLDHINMRYGAFVLPQETDLIGDTLRAYGEWAENEISLLRTLIRPGDTVLDIGACYGTHSRAFSAAVGAHGRVISFEACEQTSRILLENIALAPLSNIEAHNVAIDGISGNIISLQSLSNNRGGMHVVSSFAEPGDGGGVRTATVDEFSLPRADLMKIDVEGHESKVITGAMETLKRCRPIVFCEVNSISAGIYLYNSWTTENYLTMGIRSFATNMNNFYGNTEDKFEDASECGLLFVPKERIYDIPEKISGNVLTFVRDSEDIVALMLGQIQYLSSFWHMNQERHALTVLKYCEKPRYAEKICLEKGGSKSVTIYSLAKHFLSLFQKRQEGQDI